MDSKANWIKYLNLTAHPEGGYFNENYRNSSELNIDEKYSGKRNLATSIYYMLEYGQFSKLHRLKSDEIWYFHHGAPLKVHVFNNNLYQSYVLGTNLNESQLLQLIIPAGAIFGAEVLETNSFAILGCMVSPGFHFDDFEILKAEKVLAIFPEHKTIIEKLT